MITRSIIITCIFFLASCSNAKKEEANQNDKQESKEVGTLEVSNPEGVIIPQQSELDTLKGSLKAYAIGKIGEASFTINYYSPATRGRMIWGGLVAYDNVWVTGAHKATNIEFDKDINIGGTIVSAGKYAFFTIPASEQWTIIINKNWNQHLADDYDQAEDVVRLTVTPQTDQIHQERLRYEIESKSDTSGNILVQWDKLKVLIPFELAH